MITKLLTKMRHLLLWMTRNIKRNKGSMRREKYQKERRVTRTFPQFRWNGHIWQRWPFNFSYNPFNEHSGNENLLKNEQNYLLNFYFFLLQKWFFDERKSSKLCRRTTSWSTELAASVFRGEIIGVICILNFLY